MRHPRGWNKFIQGENILIKLLVIAVTLLIAAQILLFMAPTRLYISRVDRLEGENTMQVPMSVSTSMLEQTVAYNFAALRRKEHISVRMIKPNYNSKVSITINGKVAGNFNAGECNLTVYEGDYIEIDGTHLKAPVKFVLRVPDNKLEYPINGLIFETNGNIAAVGKVKFRNP